MKKILSLLSLLMLCVVGVNAQDDEVIFSATITATANVSFNTGSTEITSANADVIGGKMFAVSEQTDAKNLIGKQGSNFLFCMTNNNTFFKVELDKALAVGDVISSMTYSRTDTALGLFLSTSETRPNECETKLSIDKVATAAYEAFSNYTVTEGDGLVGATTFYVYRETGKSTYFNEFKISRAAQGGDEPTPVVTNKTVGLVPGVWNADGATFAAYAFNSDEDNSWFPFVEVSGAYATQIPDSYAKIIAVRLKPASADGFSTENYGLNWSNKWNQTVDIDFTVVADQSLITITGWNESDYAISNPLQEAKDALTKVIAVAVMLNTGSLDEAIATAQSALTSTDVTAIAAATQALLNDVKPTVATALSDLKNFASKYGYQDIANQVDAVTAALNATPVDIDDVSNSIAALIASAKAAAPQIIEKVANYASAMNNETLNTAIQTALATAKNAASSIKDVIAATQDVVDVFKQAAAGFVQKVAAMNIEDATVKAKLAQVAALGEDASLADYGEAIRQLIAAYNAYQLEQNPVYTVAGTIALTGYEWDTTKNEMTLNAETGLYEWTAKFITVPGDLKFKVVKNYKEWYPEGDDRFITSDYLGGEGIYTITITFDAETKEIGVTGVKRETPVYAENNVYFWESPDGIQNQNGGTAVHNKAEEGTTGRVNYVNADNHTICLNGSKDFSGDYVTITLDEGNVLKAGDEIAITAYRNKDATGKKSGALLKFDDGSTINTGEGTEFVNINEAVKGSDEYATEPNTITIVAPETADGSTTITMTRSQTSTNLFITKIEINRPEQGPEPLVISTMAIVGDFLGLEATEEDKNPNWNPTNGWEMSQSTDNPAIWTLTKEFEAAAQKYEYKATANGNWDDLVLPGGDNADFVFGTADYPAGKYNLTFTANTEEKTLTLDVEAVKPELNTYTATFTTNRGWDMVYAYAFTKTGEGENEKVTEFLGAWPGTPLVRNTETDLYDVIIEAVEAPAFIVFNNGITEGDGKDQTEDLAFEDKRAYEFNVVEPVFVLGDVNEDGGVTTTDAVMAVDFALENSVPTEAQFKAADVNESNDITVSDAVGIVNIALEIPVENVEPAGARMDYGTNYLTMNGQEIFLTNTMGFAGFQMDVTLAEGAQLNGAQLTERASGMMLSYNRIGDNTWRIIALSLQNSTISGNDGALLKLDIVGNSTIDVTNIEFADAAARAYTLGFSGEATGISSLNGIDADAHIYNVNGVRTNTMHKGMNIVRNANGEVKKMFVK